MSDTTLAAETSAHFMAGRYEEAVAGLRAMRPDLSDEDMGTELSLAAVKILSEYYAALRGAAEQAVKLIDAALLADRAPLADYAAARDVLNAALSPGARS